MSQPMLEQIDGIFDSGHATCNGPLTTLHLCQSCAEFLAQLLAELSLFFTDTDHECEYYLRAFAADVAAQTAIQVADLDAELAALSR